MKTVTLNNGVEMPIVGMGTWPYKGNELKQVFRTAWELGYRAFDTASAYGNEQAIGEVMREMGIKRDEIFLTSKIAASNLLWHPRNRFGLRIPIYSVAHAYEKSCRNLGVDYLDLYLIHWPYPGYQKMWKAMSKLYRQGRVRAIGVSSFMPLHLEDLRQVSDVVPVVDQVEMNPYNSRGDVVEYCQSHNIQPEAYSPLGRGMRTPLLLKEPTLVDIAAAHNVTPAQVILRWLTQRQVVVIPRSNKPEKLEQNFHCVDFDLTDAEMEAINALNVDDFIKGDSRDVTTAGAPTRTKCNPNPVKPE